jgi:4,5-dihydroxyphthalate decarboxylase
MSGGGRKTLKTLIGTYPHTAPLKSGALRSDRFDFEFTEIVPVWDGFKGMIRDDRYDVSEMAIVTYLLAKAHGKPLALLPAGMIGRFQHPARGR